MLINFVSNLPADLQSGGFSAMNAAALEALRTTCEVHYVGPMDPPVSRWRRALSKALRVAGIKADFAAYSAPRLMAFAQGASRHARRDAALDFFHGFTPWIALRPERPYVAWSDCTFRDYMTIYHPRDSFRAADLARIETAEAAWLRGARAVAFTSAWAAGRAIADYRLDPGRVSVVGIFGETALPDTDAYAGAPQFAFISTNFEAKGGPAVLAAFREVRAHCPGASLVVVGDSPTGLGREPGVTTTGFLRKEDVVQSRRFRQVLATSRAVVHPTRSDIAPLLLVEAGYFGCPVISSRRFAIPEIVDDGRTGLLLDDPSDPKALAQAMLWMLQADEDYLAMRRAAWTKTRERHAKAGFEARLRVFVEAAA